VGIVADGKYLSLTEEPKPAAFYPISRNASTLTTLIVRSWGAARVLLAVIDRNPQAVEEAIR
jgi:hypothetical protein